MKRIIFTVSLVANIVLAAIFVHQRTATRAQVSLHQNAASTVSSVSTAPTATLEPTTHHPANAESDSVDVSTRDSTIVLSRQALRYLKIRPFRADMRLSAEFGSITGASAAEIEALDKVSIEFAAQARALRTARTEIIEDSISGGKLTITPLGDETRQLVGVALDRAKQTVGSDIFAVYETAFLRHVSDHATEYGLMGGQYVIQRSPNNGDDRIFTVTTINTPSDQSQAQVVYENRLTRDELLQLNPLAMGLAVVK